MDHSVQLQLHFFFTVMNKTPQLKLFQIHNNLFGLKRGEIISVLQCIEETKELVTETKNCTSEIQVKDNEEIKYVTFDSRIIKTQVNVVECKNASDEANVFFGEWNGVKTSFVQEKFLYEYHDVNGTLGENINLFLRHKPLNYTDILDIPSFAGHSIYSMESRIRRRNFIFEGENIESTTHSITRSIVR